MITFKEIIKNTPMTDIPHSDQLNIDELLKRMNKIREAYGKPMQVTSGYRSMQDHLRIYSEKAAKAGKQFDPKKVPMGSCHLTGEAVDIYDPNKELQAWCKANTKILEDVGLWMEDFSATPNWCHFQIRPPRSGSRFFMP